jgi:tetratricopeptide (TPR) repeat protein
MTIAAGRALAGALIIGATVLALAPVAATAQSAEQWNCRGDTDDLDGQIKGCTRAIESGKYHGKNLAWAYTNRGSVYDYLRDFDHALADLDEAIRLDPDSIAAYQNRAASYRNTGRLDRALADLNRVAELAPNDARTFLSRGIIYFKLGQTERSIADYDTSLRLNPNFTASLYGRGVAKLKLGDSDGGNADIRDAKAAQPQIAEIFVKFFDIAP